MPRLGLVVSEFNRPVTEEMEELATAAIADGDGTLAETVYVPGAYDSPLAADRLARQDDIDAVVVIGAIITGDTGHDLVIAEAVATQLSSISISRDIPVVLGVTGPNMSAAEARERVDKGKIAVESALSLLATLPDPEE